MENIEKLQQLLLEKYDYCDGELLFKHSSKGIKKGKIAGSIDKYGYKILHINGKNYKVHKLIFLYHNGYLPKTINHIDRNKLNNNIENLQEVNDSVNNYINSVKSNSKSKVKNVYHNELRDSYQVIISIKGKKESFGYYKNLSMAKYIAEFIHSKYLEFDKLNVRMLKDMALNRYMNSLYIDNNS